MEDVEYTIQSEEEYVMGSDVLDFFKFVNHEELWQDGESFEPDTERPSEVHGV